MPYSATLSELHGSPSVATTPCVSEAKQPVTRYVYDVHNDRAAQCDLVHRRHHSQEESPLIYIGVTLLRPPDCATWGMSLFPFDQYLVVGGVQQEHMQRFTAWAWATTAPPRIGAENFRSFFGPLHSTCLLQLVPGDVIVSINGQTGNLHHQMFQNVSQLDIVAVRHETVRRYAHLARNEGEFRIAQFAFRSIQPALLGLLLGATPNPCRRTLFPLLNEPAHKRKLSPQKTVSHIRAATPRQTKGTKSEPTNTTLGPKSAPRPIPNPSLRNGDRGPDGSGDGTLSRPAAWDEMRRSKREACESHENVHLPSCSPGTKVQVHRWLEVRKDQWRSDRAKRRRCSGPIRKGAMTCASRMLYRDNAHASQWRTTLSQHPLIYAGFKLQRESVKEPWGIHVSHTEGSFLGVNHASDIARSHTLWGWATTAPIPGELMSSTDESLNRAFFESQPLHSSSMLNLELGDVIISIDGRPISSFTSLSDIAHYMKGTTSLFVIALRHQQAQEAARAEWKEAKDGANMRDWPHRMSNAALRHILPHLYQTPNLASLLFQFQHAKTGFRGQDPCNELSRISNAVKNTWFCDDEGNPITFEGDDEFDIDDGSRACDFLPRISSFPSWLEERKAAWRKGWDIRSTESVGWLYDDDDSSPSISSDFWTHQGYPTFEIWLTASTFKWKQSYSWTRKKREILEKERDEVVHYPSNFLAGEAEVAEQMSNWLRVRKQQWRFLRRKRQRQREQQGLASASPSDEQNSQKVSSATKSTTSRSQNDTFSEPHASDLKYPAPKFPRSVVIPRQTSTEMKIIDAVLEEQERQFKALQERPPLDITFLFDAKHGAPDDVVAHCLRFLHCSEHGKLLCVSRATSTAMKDRDEVWRQLCPAHWTIPRRPRKRWHEFYVTKVREMEEASRKWSDGFLNKANDVLLKADHLNKIEKLVRQGEKQLGFDINYTSGVVCERNSLLNLAVIYSRPKVVRWLLETKGANVETSDRGNFTPLINAAWAGDRHLVRLLLSHGANRTKIGRGHFFKPLASPDFEGLNAEGWARKQGHHDLANMIKVGL